MNAIWYWELYNSINEKKKGKKKKKKNTKCAEGKKSTNIWKS